MNCEELTRWIDPLLDGELDAKNALDVRSHLDACPACQQRYEAAAALSAGLRKLNLADAAPPDLRRRIFAEVAPPPASHVTPSLALQSMPRGRAAVRWFMFAGWPVAAVACGILATVLLHQRSAEADDIVSAHVRSLLVDHLSDVVSTDHHTVKPWFAGKIDFAPIVPDLGPAGFELLGGRLDYVRDRTVAAIVYRKHGHIINVLISSAGREGLELPPAERVKGYALRWWQQAGLDLVAVSDIDPLELDKLEQGYRAPLVPAAEPMS